MNVRTAVTSLGAGVLLIACGGSTPDSTGTVSAGLSSHAADAATHHRGRGMACKPPDGGTSPCARGDGGDEQEGDADELEIDDQGEGGADLGDDEGGDQGDDEGGDRGDDGGGHAGRDAGHR